MSSFTNHFFGIDPPKVAMNIYDYGDIDYSRCREVNFKTGDPFIPQPDEIIVGFNPNFNNIKHNAWHGSNPAPVCEASTLAVNSTAKVCKFKNSFDNRKIAMDSIERSPMDKFSYDNGKNPYLSCSDGAQMASYCIADPWCPSCGNWDENTGGYSSIVGCASMAPNEFYDDTLQADCKNIPINRTAMNTCPDGYYLDGSNLLPLNRFLKSATPDQANAETYNMVCCKNKESDTFTKYQSLKNDNFKLCCSSDLPKGGKEEKICNYLNLVNGSNDCNILLLSGYTDDSGVKHKGYCEDHMDDPDCQHLCQRPDIDCQTTITNFCNNHPDVAKTITGNLCGCFHPDSVYNNYQDDLKKLGVVDLTTYDRDCIFPTCSDSFYKTYAWKSAGISCPAITQCLNNVTINNDGTIGEANINQINNCVTTIEDQKSGQYECINGNCLPHKGGQYTDDKCQGKCQTQKFYSCKDNSCVEDDKGKYLTSNCDGACDKKYKCNPSKGVCEIDDSGIDLETCSSNCKVTGKKYSCVNGNCIEDAKGQFLISNCCNPTPAPSGGLSTGAIIGIVIGILIFLIFVGIGIYFSSKK